MAMQPRPGGQREGFLKKVNRLLDEWSLFVLMFMFGLTCFCVGAAAGKWYLLNQ